MRGAEGFDPEATLHDESPLGATTDKKASDRLGRVPTRLKSAPVDQPITPSGLRKVSRPITSTPSGLRKVSRERTRTGSHKVSQESAPLTPAERNRVAIATVVMIGLAVVAVWASPTRRVTAVELKAPSRAETPSPRQKPAVASLDGGRGGDTPAISN